MGFNDGQAQCREQGPVEKHMLDLENNIEELEGVIISLRTRLALILSPEPPTIGPEGNTDGQALGTSDFSNRIFLKADQVSRLISMVTSMTARLEV